VEFEDDDEFEAEIIAFAEVEIGEKVFRAYFGAEVVSEAKGDKVSTAIETFFMFHDVLLPCERVILR
jgi:hypothetical protein